ncbi:MAG: DNA-binding NtrC family response regulator [Paracoccaceae bacterium]|jgi:DNA-binding NtrC family response regulator
MARILLIEDDPAVRKFMARLLATQAHDMIEAGSIATGIALLNEDRHFDLVIVDFWLADGDAIPLLDRIQDDFPQMPVILVTGGGGHLPMETTMALAEMRGVRQVIQKPFRAAQMLDAIGALS